MNKLPVYLIFGSGGVLGEAFLDKLSGPVYAYRVFPFDHQKADITDAAHIQPLMEYIRPSVVINCAAVNDEDICQEAKAGAFSVHSRGPQILAESCKKYNAKLVHFSSCEVFDGKSCTPYSERHSAKPINILGQSKVSGELAIKEACDDHLIIRPGMVFSYESPSCIPSWIAAAERGEEIAVLDDTIVSPTYTVDLVDATMDLLAMDAKGIFHIANGDAASRQSFAEATLSLAGLRAKVLSVNPESQKFFKAPIPKYSVLSTKKYSLTTAKSIRPWLDALKHCLFNMHRYKP